MGTHPGAGAPALRPACPTAKEMLRRDRDCLLPVEEAGVLWDSVCFLFLLLQRRVFLSRYFLHVRAELQATALQASRSAQATGSPWAARPCSVTAQFSGRCPTLPPPPALVLAGGGVATGRPPPRADSPIPAYGRGVSSWGRAVQPELCVPGVTSSPRRGFALYNAANLKSIDLHRKAEEKSLAQLKRQ